MLHLGNMIAFQIRSDVFTLLKRDIALLCKAAIYSLFSEGECDILSCDKTKRYICICSAKRKYVCPMGKKGGIKYASE